MTSDDRPQPILVLTGDEGCTWAVPSESKGWMAHLLVLYNDGTAWCGCPRQKKGDCWHVQEARKSQYSLDYTESLDDRVAQISADFTAWLHREEAREDA